MVFQGRYCAEYKGIIGGLPGKKRESWKANLTKPGIPVHTFLFQIIVCENQIEINHKFFLMMFVLMLYFEFFFSDFKDFVSFENIAYTTNK